MVYTAVRGLTSSIQCMDMLYIHFSKKGYITILIKWLFYKTYSWALHLFSSDQTSPITNEKCFKHLQSPIPCLYLILKLVSLFSSKSIQILVVDHISSFPKYPRTPWYHSWVGRIEEMELGFYHLIYKAFLWWTKFKIQTMMHKHYFAGLKLVRHSIINGLHRY